MSGWLPWERRMDGRGTDDVELDRLAAGMRYSRGGGKKVRVSDLRVDESCGRECERRRVEVGVYDATGPNRELDTDPVRVRVDVVLRTEPSRPQLLRNFVSPFGSGKTDGDVTQLGSSS